MERTAFATGSVKELLAARRFKQLKFLSNLSELVEALPDHGTDNESEPDLP